MVVKAELVAAQAVADKQAAELAQAEPGGAAAAPSPPQPSDAGASPAERPSGASAASTSSSQRELLQQTQAANRIIPAEGPVSPVPPDGAAYEGGDLFIAPAQPLPGMELQLEDIVRREDIDSAMEQDPAGERPAAAMQVLRDLHLRLVMHSALQPGQDAILKGQIISPSIAQAWLRTACRSDCHGSMQGYSCEQVRSCCNLQDEGQGEDERHLRQLMDLMHQEDSCSDEEGDGSARLMALAAQVATQGGQLQPVSQQVWPSCHRAAACMRYLGYEGDFAKHSAPLYSAVWYSSKVS